MPVAEAAASASNVTRLVYLAAHMLEPGESVVAPLGGPWYEQGAKLLDPLPAEYLFHDVPEEISAWAVERLRPQSARVFEEPVTAAAWRTVPTAAIVCADDRSFPALFAERLRAATVVRELPGSHSPLLARPRELAEVVGEVTERL